MTSESDFDVVLCITENLQKQMHLPEEFCHYHETINTGKTIAALFSVVNTFNSILITTSAMNALNLMKVC